MPRAAAVPRSALDRTLAALKAAGCEITGARVDKTGSVTFLTTKGGEVQESPPVSALDAWRQEKRGARAAEGH